MPGHGKSGHSATPQIDYSFNAISKAMLNAINDLQLESYIVVGLSLGSNIIGEMANKLTDCKGFFMVGPPIIGGKITPPEVLLPFGYGHILVSPFPSDEDIEHYIAGLVCTNNPKLHDELKRYFKQTDPKFREQLGLNIAQATWSDEIGNIKQTGLKTAVIYGAEEKITNAGALKDVGLQLWQNKVHLVKDAGHLVHLDQPELFSQLLLEFADDMFAQ